MSPTILGLNVNPSFLLLIGTFIGMFTMGLMYSFDNYWLVLITSAIVFFIFGAYFNSRFKVVEKDES